MLSYLSIAAPGSARLHARSGPGPPSCRSGLCLITLSTRIGTVAGRVGARKFLTLGRP